jgi:apolipoprotein N-acyltransferase
MLRQVGRFAGAALSAVLLSCCFPSGGLWWLAWFSFIPFLLIMGASGLKRSFGLGYLAGLLFFCLTLFWIHHVTALGLIFLSAYLALYWSVFACLVSWSVSWPLIRRVLFLSSAWVVLEYVRGHALTGFGWSALAHTQSSNILLIQIADITGTYGVSFILMAFNVAAAAFIQRRCRLAPDDRGALWLVLVMLLIMLSYGAWRLTSPMGQGRVRVALVQGNVSLADYWDPNLKSYVVEKHLMLSRQALAQKPDLIVWPETSFPQFIWEYPELFEQVRSFARENHVKLMLGAVTRTGEDYFNTAILINERGETDGMYRKQHLVLFGEYIPFRREIPWLARLAPIDDFTPGEKQIIFNVGKGRDFSALVCFEDTIPSLARDAINGGAGFLVNITNDGWFGASRQPRMHLDNAVFRAVEDRVSILRATNTGMSCGILPTGGLAGCVSDVPGRKIMVSGVTVVEVPAQPAQRALFRKYGDIFALLCFLGILGMMVQMKFIREKKDV